MLKLLQWTQSLFSAWNLLGAGAGQVVEGHEPGQVDEDAQDQTDQEAWSGISHPVTEGHIFVNRGHYTC